MHPALIELYTWILTGHTTGKNNVRIDEIFFMNNHGSIWVGTDNPTGQLIKSKNKYKTLAEALKESPINWNPIK